MTDKQLKTLIIKTYCSLNSIVEYCYKVKVCDPTNYDTSYRGDYIKKNRCEAPHAKKQRIQLQLKQSSCLRLKDFSWQFEAPYDTRGN